MNQTPLKRSEKKMGSGGLSAPTRAQSELMDKLTDQVGCVVCLFFCRNPDGSRCEGSEGAIHHILSGQRRISHWHILPLCHKHHQAGTEGHPSRHSDRGDDGGLAEFEAAYATEMELVVLCEEWINQPYVTGLLTDEQAPQDCEKDSATESARNHVGTSTEIGKSESASQRISIPPDEAMESGLCLAESNACSGGGGVGGIRKEPAHNHQRLPGGLREIQRIGVGGVEAAEVRSKVGGVRPCLDNDRTGLEATAVLNTCTRCGETKPISMFRKNRNQCYICKRQEDNARRLDPEYRDRRNRLQRARRLLQNAEKREQRLAKQAEYKAHQRERTLFLSARKRAQKLGIEFSIELADIEIPKFCPILGIEILFRGGMDNRDTSASIDRFDPAAGYTKDNTWVISYRANRIKNDSTPDEMLKIFAALTREVRRREQRVTE